MQLGAARLEAMHPGVVERRHVAVLLGGESLQPRLARMHDEGVAAGVGDDVDEARKIRVLVLVVDADAALDGDRDRYRFAHGAHGGGHLLRVAHQAGADQVVLHPIAGTADVEVDLVVAPRLGDGRAFGQLAGIAAAQLQGEWMLHLIEAQEALARAAVQDGPGGHHLGIEQGVARQGPGEGAVVAGCPVHHGGHGEGTVELGHRHHGGVGREGGYSIRTGQFLANGTCGGTVRLQGPWRAGTTRHAETPRPASAGLGARRLATRQVCLIGDQMTSIFEACRPFWP